MVIGQFDLCMIIHTRHIIKIVQIFFIQFLYLRGKMIFGVRLREYLFVCVWMSLAPLGCDGIEILKSQVGNM